MGEMITLSTVAICCLAIGALLGYFLLGNLKPEQQSRAALDKQFNEMQQQQKDYQLHVNTHFDQTAVLLTDLAESYRSVHNHIVEGAQNLSSTGISPLQPLPEGRPVLDNKPAALNPAEQPLDYAPRQPGSKGALHESFGIDENGKAVDQEHPTAPHL